MGFDSKNYLRSEERLANLLSRHIQFDLLTHLTLDNCEDWEVLLELIVEQHIRAREPIKLKHFAYAYKKTIRLLFLLLMPIEGYMTPSHLSLSFAPVWKACVFNGMLHGILPQTQSIAYEIRTLCLQEYCQRSDALCAFSH